MTKHKVDDEVKELAELVLVNAFYEDFSALVNTYLEAAKGLNQGDLEYRLSDTANVFSRDIEAEGDIQISIWTRNELGQTAGHQTLLEALKFEPAVEVHVQGEKVFERRGGEWYFVGDEHD